MKKGLIAFAIVNIFTTALAAFTFSMGFSNQKGTDVNEIPFDMSNITEAKDTPKDGTKPSDYDIVQNIQYASGYLKNNRNFKALTTGQVISKAGVNVTQEILNARYVTKDYMFQEAVSYSSLVPVASQKFYNSEKAFIRNGKAKSISNVTWANEATPVSYEYIYTNYGFLPDQLNSYFYSYDTVLDSSSMEVVDGKYVLHVDLNDQGTINSRREVVTLSGALDYPKYNKIHADITIDDNWKVYEISVSETYSIKKSVGIVVEAKCEQNIVEKFEYGVSIDQGIIDFYKSFFNKDVSDNVDKEEEKTALTYLQSMTSVLASKNTFDINVSLSENQNLHGQVELNLANNEEVNINLENKYFVKYKNGEVYSSLDGINFSLNEKYINYAMSQIMAKFSNTESAKPLGKNPSLGNAPLDIDALINQIMENMTLEIKDGIALVNIKAESQGIKLDVDLSFDEEDNELINITGDISYNETQIGLNILTTNEFEGIDFNEIEFNDLSNSTWIIDEALGLTTYKGYQFDGKYIYKNIEFNISSNVSLDLDVEVDINFGFVGESFRKHLSIIKIKDLYYLSYGNIKVSASEKTLMSVINDLIELYQNSDSNLPTQDVIDGINLSQLVISDFKTTSEGDLVLSVEFNDEIYDAKLIESENGGFILTIDKLDLNFDVVKFDGQVESPANLNQYLNENQLSQIVTLCNDVNNIIENDQINIFGSVNCQLSKFNKVEYNILKNKDKYLLDSVLIGENNFSLKVFLDGNTVYVDSEYQNIKLSFTFDKNDFKSLTETIYHTLADYYHFDIESEVKSLLDDLLNQNKITFEEVISYVINSNFENQLTIGVLDDNKISLKYNDEVSIQISNQDSIINLSGNYQNYQGNLSLLRKEFNYQIDSNTIYTPIRNIKYASFLADAYIDLINYQGYQIDGTIVYKDITSNISLTYDQNKNFVSLIELENATNKKKVLVTKVDNIYYLQHGNINVSVYESELDSMINLLSSFDESNFNQSEIENIKNIISELDLFINSIDGNENEVITNLKVNGRLYPISLGYIDNKLSLGSNNDLFDLKLELKENLDDVTIPSGTYLTYEELKETYQDVKGIYDEIIGKDYEIGYQINYQEISLEGKMIEDKDEYLLTSKIQYQGEIINIRGIVKLEQVYLEISYEGVEINVVLQKQDGVSLINQIYNLIKEKYQIEVPKVEINENEILRILKEVLKSNYEEQVSISKNENVLEVRYLDRVIKISDHHIEYEGQNEKVVLNLTNRSEEIKTNKEKYCEVTGVSEIIKLLDATKEVIKYEGYHIDGGLTYQDYDISFDAIYDKNNNIEIIIDVMYLTKIHELVITYYNDVAYIRLGNIKVSLNKNEVSEYINYFVTLMNLDQNVNLQGSNVKEKIINIIKKINLEISSINIKENGIDSIINLSKETYLVDAKFENHVLSVNIPDFYQLMVNLSESKEIVQEIIIDESFVTNEDIKYFSDVINKNKNSINNNQFNVELSLNYDGYVINGNVKYLGINQIYGEFNLTGKIETNIEIYKVNEYVYLDVLYNNYQISVKYVTEDNDFLLSGLKNSFKLIDTRFNLGIYEQILGTNTNTKSELELIDEYLRLFLSGNYEEVILVTKSESNYQITYENYQVLIGRDINNLDIKLNYLDKNLTLNVREDYQINKVIDDTKYTLLDVNGDFSSLVNDAFIIMDYVGYLVEFEFELDSINYQVSLYIDQNKNISLDMTILYQNEEHLFYVDYIDNVCYIEYGNIKAKLTNEEILLLIDDIKSMLNIKDNTEPVEKGLTIISDFVKALTLDNGSLILDFIFERNSYHLNLFERENGIGFSSELYSLNGQISEFTSLVNIVEQDYLTYADLKVAIDYCVEARDYFYLNKGYLDLNGVFSIGATNYRITATGKYDYTDRVNAKFAIDLIVKQILSDNSEKEVLTGTIAYQHNNVYLDVTYNKLYGLYFYVDKTDASKAIDSIITKLADSPFNNGNYGLNLEVMQMIKDLLELDPDVILSFDHSQEINPNKKNTFEMIISSLKSVLDLKLNSNMVIDVDQNKNLILQYNPYFNGIISNSTQINNDVTQEYIEVDGTGSFNNINYDAQVKFHDYQEFIVDTNGYVYLSDLEILSNAAMNTINARKYDVSGSFDLKLLGGILSIGMKVEKMLLELDENQVPSGVIKLVTGTNSLITKKHSSGRVSGDINGYIYLDKLSGKVYLRRDFKTGIISKKDHTEYMEYASQSEFAKDFLNAFIWLTMFNEDFAKKFENQKLTGEYSKILTSYNVSTDKLTYEMILNLKCLSTLFSESSSIKFNLTNAEKEYYMNSLKLDVNILSGVLKAKGTFNLNSYGKDLDYSNLPNVSEMHP